MLKDVYKRQGERAGNAALEEIASALYVRGDRYGQTTSIKLDQLYPTSQVLGQIITFRPSPNKAIVGDNAFAHESGTVSYTHLYGQQNCY